jgi:hypothetical protein
MPALSPAAAPMILNPLFEFKFNKSTSLIGYLLIYNFLVRTPNRGQTLKHTKERSGMICKFRSV